MARLPQAGFTATGVDLPEVDISDAAAMEATAWQDYDIIINAAAWTNVDGAETPEGRRLSWRANATGPANLARAAAQHGLTLVHLSSKYTFDGTAEVHTEEEDPSPLGVYGQSKAGGDAAVASAPQHYLVRTSWVVGEGKNFVRTMAALADKGIEPKVVADQVGRLTFTSDLAAGIIHLLTSGAPWGTYNLSGEGEVVSWADVAKRVYELTGHSPESVTPITTEEYFAGQDVAPRPLISTLDLSRIEATGFTPADSMQRLEDYVSALQSKVLFELIPHNQSIGDYKIVVGMFVSTLLQLDFAYQTALQTLNYVEGIHAKKGLYFFSDYKLPALFADFTHSWQGKELLTPFHILIEHEDCRLLLKTLQQYFLSNCDLAHASQKLFIHPNTLRYRLNKIEQITSLLFNKIEDKFILFLGAMCLK